MRQVVFDTVAVIIGAAIIKKIGGLKIAKEAFDGIIDKFLAAFGLFKGISIPNLIVAIQGIAFSANGAGTAAFDSVAVWIMNGIHCMSCGDDSLFEEPLKPLYAKCECGQRFKYMTNMDEEMFDMDCMQCGTPIPIKWNGHDMCYQTIED